MNLRYSILAIVLGILLHTESQAQQRKYVNEFMNIGVGARGLGMSGSQVASTTDVTAAFWNPAGIAYQNTDMQLGLMHSEYFSSIAKYDYIGATFPLKNRKGVIGFSAIRFAVDDIPYTINLVQPDGTVDYSKVRSISSADYGGLISYARPVVVGRWKDREDISLMWGTNFKIIHRSVGSMANAWGVGLDFGLQGRFGRWKLGAVVRDVTTTYTVWSFSLTEQEKQVFAQTGNEIVSRSSEINTPRAIIGGGRVFPINHKLSVLGELNFDITSDGSRYANLINAEPFSIDPRLGAEFNYDNKVFLRTGVGQFQRVLTDEDTTGTNYRTLFQPTLGLGVQIKNFAIDYAFSSLNIQSNALYSHFISLKLDIRNRKREEEKNKE